jgi:hypothetical protein
MQQVPVSRDDDVNDPLLRGLEDAIIGWVIPDHLHLLIGRLLGFLLVKPTDRVVRRIERDFPTVEMQEKVVRELSGYGEQDHHREPERVQLAVLILANGDLDQLQDYLQVASHDYRDVLWFSGVPPLNEVPLDWIG